MRDFVLTPGLKTALEIYIEGLEDVRGLHEGIHFLAWEYLAENVFTGVDGRISGPFLRDLNSLLEFLYLLEEHLKKT